MIETKTNKKCNVEGCRGELIVVVKRTVAELQCDCCENIMKRVVLKIK